MSASIPAAFHSRYMALSESERLKFDLLYQGQAKDATVALICAIFGVYHFYVGKIGLGILMILTGGGFMIWWLITIINAKKEVEAMNTSIAQQTFVAHFS